MNNKSYPEPVEALILVLAVFAGLIVLAAVYAFVSSTVISPESIEKNTRLFFIFGGSLFLIIPLLYSRAKKYPIQSLFRFNPVSREVIFLSVTTGISLSIVGDELDRLLSRIIPIPDWILEQMRPLVVEGWTDWALVIGGAVFVAAIAEEGLFRGFFQVTLEKKGDATRAVMLSSLTWTIIHMNPYWAIQIFLMGIIMGFLAWRTDSIIPSIIVHGTNNFLALIFINYKIDEKAGWYLWGEHVSPIVVIAALATLVLSIRQISQFYQQVPE